MKATVVVVDFVAFVAFAVHIVVAIVVVNVVVKNVVVALLLLISFCLVVVNKRAQSFLCPTQLQC